MSHAAFASALFAQSLPRGSEPLEANNFTLLLIVGLVAVIVILFLIALLASSSHPVFWLVSTAWAVGLVVVIIAVFGYLASEKNNRFGAFGYSHSWWQDGIILWPCVVFGGLGGITVARLHFSRRQASVTIPHDVALAATPAPQPLRHLSPPVLNCPTCGSSIPKDSPLGLCPRCLIRRAMPSPSMTRGQPTRAVEPLPVSELAAMLPHLEVLELIGVGGMGAVYKARQPTLDRLVAVKIVQSPTGEDAPEFATRFAREARAMAKLDHPNIVAVHESGTAGDLPYLVMEYVDGITLRDAMVNKVLTLTEALAVIPQICDALDYAHHAGVVHRDIKPENILIDQTGRVRIADFGLAKLADSPGVSLTHSRQMMGTPHYMAPEQWERPNEVDHRADIYALGVVLYELLTGELPLGRFDLPSQKGKGDARMDQIILLALAKEPNQRYQHAGEVKTALSAIDLSEWKAP